jgi:PAS domain S-box-containing protein
MLIASESLVESINDGFIMVDSTWYVTYMNRRAQVMLRCLDSSVTSRRLWDLMPEDPSTDAYRQLHRAVAQQISVEFDVFYPLLYVWHEVRAIPSTNGVALILRDITDRQWLVRREAEHAYLRNLFNDAPVAITITRGPYHQYEFVNNFARKLIGGRNIEGLTVREAFPEVEGQGFFELMDQVYRTGEPYYAEERFIQFARDGTGVLEDAYFTFTYQALRGFDAQVSGILNISVEVTDQVRARLQSEQLAAERTAVLGHLPDGVIVTDAIGRIIYVNEIAAKLHGEAKLDVMPDDYTKTYHLLTIDGQPYPIEDLPLTRAVRHNEVIQGAEWRIRRPDGQDILVEGSASPVYAPTGIKIGAVLTLREKGRTMLSAVSEHLL